MGAAEIATMTRWYRRLATNNAVSVKSKNQPVQMRKNAGLGTVDADTGGNEKRKLGHA
jgi:hypothetical protein